MNGVAAGAGLNLALACDLRVASDRATFGETFARVGLHPDWGGTYLLPRLVGQARSLEMCWLGDMIDAAEALRIGLVNRVLSHAQFAEETQALAMRLANAPRTSVMMAKARLKRPYWAGPSCPAAIQFAIIANNALAPLPPNTIRKAFRSRRRNRFR